MKFQGQSFAKQVQVDLLALSDDDLLYIIEQWGPGKETTGVSPDPREAMWFALGYRHVSPENELISPSSEARPEGEEHWLAPSAAHLRAVLKEMDGKQLTQHVIALAFQSLHVTHPEWGDSSTFNAHLANYLRQIRTPSPQRDDELRTKKIPRTPSHGTPWD